METGTSVDYLKAKIDRSKEDLSDAKELLAQRKFRLSVNRAYYSVFHIVSATLAVMGHARSKHSGVEAAFHQYLISTGFLNRELGVTYKLARKLREDADYGIGKKFTEEMARDMVDQCGVLVSNVERYLAESGRL